MRWTVLVPLKAMPRAKTRLLASTAKPSLHLQLVQAIRADTLSAARQAGGVARVLVVVDAADAGGGDAHFVQSVPGLNEGLEEAAAYAAARWPEDGVAALVGDLPALRADELADALLRAATFDRAFVADADGYGTTLLTALPDVPLRPRFGPGSAARHGDGAVPLDAGQGLRHDVDTADDLRAAALLGLGPNSEPVAAAVLAAAFPC